MIFSLFWLAVIIPHILILRQCRKKFFLNVHLESQLCLNSMSKKYFIKITTTLEKNLLASIVPMQITPSIGEISKPVDYAILFVNTYSLENVVHPSNNRALTY